ncbi:MAG: hypothetical protein RLZZ241_306 [Bacteroidota bacterium]
MKPTKSPQLDTLQFIPNLSIDVVILGFEDNKLKVLLLRIGSKWLLPGGYIGCKEGIDDAATRILEARTGLVDPHLQFLSVFGSADRRFGEDWELLRRNIGISLKNENWIKDRFITLAYYSLIQIDEAKPHLSTIDDAYGWFDVDTLPELWMDHKEIVLTARERLKQDMRLTHITYNLLPDTFTMPELHQLHETILQETLDRSRFQKKMLSSGIFERLPELAKDRPGRNPYQYRVKKQD